MGIAASGFDPLVALVLRVSRHFSGGFEFKTDKVALP